MKLEDFKLEFKLNPNKGNHNLHYYVDGTYFDHAFTDFINKYSGDFFIDIGKDSLGVDLFPDFSMIFNEIPPLLLKSVHSGKENKPLEESPYLWMIEQDIELRLYIKVLKEEVWLLAKAAPRSKYGLYGYDGMQWTVDRKNFFEEWLKLTRSVLSEMLLINPSLEKRKAILPTKNSWMKWSA